MFAYDRLMLAQRSFDDLGAPLFEVPFCVLDIETTGGAPADLGITEVGAQRYRGGELEAEFSTLVNPGMAIPPFITVLTGITQAMVIEAPRLAEMLPSFLEFLGDAVIVGHNVRYDLSFLNAAAQQHGYGRLPNRSVDTLGLARRLVGSDARNLKLATLAAHFGSPVTPTHRALDDTRATAHVFWSLIEQAGTIGATHLDDLLRLPTARGRPHYRKMHLTEGLPRSPGVYLFLDRDGTVIYVGKAKDLRSRVRSYFYGDTRRSIHRMLTELHTIEHRVCETELEASVVELRLIAAHRPRHNRRSKPRSPHWVRLTREAYPRLALARTTGAPALAHLGPFTGRTQARLVMEAIWDAIPIRRCTGRPGSRDAPCGFAQLGVAACPCDGNLTEAEYRPTVDRLLAALDGEPAHLLNRLADRVASHARARRFEEAGWARDRHRALGRALERRHAWHRLQAAGALHAASDDAAALIERGRLVVSWRDSSRPPLHALTEPDTLALETPESTTDATEADLLWTWLTSPGVAVVSASGEVDLRPAPVERLERIAV
jgi:DNA polymerase III subunit epsilon